MLVKKNKEQGTRNKEQNRKLFFVLCSLLFVVSYLVVPVPAQAAPDCSKCGKIENKSAFLPDCVYYEGNRTSLGKDTKGNEAERKDVTCESVCGCRNVNVFIQLLVKAANWFMGFVGAAALVMFVYGGFMMLTSGGVAEKVDTGKKALVAAVVGLAIIFSAQLLMRFVLEQTVTKGLGGKGEELQVNISAPAQPPVSAPSQ